MWRFLKNLWSWNFISALVLLLGVIFIFGVLVWLFERKRNPEEFGGGARGILQYEIERQDLNNKMEVLQKTLKKDYYSYSFPKGSPWLTVINPELIKTLKTMEWRVLVRDY